jgi:uncharacterized membrane-anchored protein
MQSRMMLLLVIVVVVVEIIRKLSFIFHITLSTNVCLFTVCCCCVLIVLIAADCTMILHPISTHRHNTNYCTLLQSIFVDFGTSVGDDEECHETGDG